MENTVEYYPIYPYPAIPASVTYRGKSKTYTLDPRDTWYLTIAAVPVQDLQPDDAKLVRDIKAYHAGYPGFGWTRDLQRERMLTMLGA